MTSRESRRRRARARRRMRAWNSSANFYHPDMKVTGRRRHDGMRRLNVEQECRWFAAHSYTDEEWDRRFGGPEVSP